MEFVVIDLETTGISTGHGHRIVEFAGLRLASDGTILKQFETLIDPKRDLGPTHIHGITGADVQGAPHFEAVAGDILEFIRGAVVTAHNASFDMNFLNAEMKRLGHDLQPLASLCTINLCSKIWPNIRKRTLSSVCDHLQIAYPHQHMALADAKATAMVLRMALQRDARTVFASIIGECHQNLPHLPVSGQRHVRQQQDTPHTPSFLSRLVQKLPASKQDIPEMQEYLALLDQALLDRIITVNEGSELLALARNLGFSHDQVMSAHRRYLHDLVWYALEDGVITERENRDLRLVSQLLGINVDELDGIIQKIKNGEGPEELLLQEHDMTGKSVCFTGSLCCTVDGERLTRSMAQQLAQEKGLQVAKNVTGSLDILVVADPNTQSSKARKARDQNIQILAETAFWLRLGVEVQ